MQKKKKVLLIGSGSVQIWVDSLLSSAFHSKEKYDFDEL
jgi:hypothetical protein